MARLVAVMYTDIVGYTSITEEDDARALVLNAKHQQVLHKYIQQYAGVLHEIVGDGSLSHFPSGTQCIECAIRMQEEFREEPVVPIRIGIHLGEIRGEDSLIYGNPINIASRIESMAIANSILLSKNVLDAITGRTQFDVVSLGVYAFKHVRQPLEIFAVKSDGLVVPNRETVEGKFKVLERKDIVVFDEWDDRELINRLPAASVICQQAVCSYGFINYNYTRLRNYIRRGGEFNCVFVHPESPAIQIAPERQTGAAQNIEYIRGQVRLAFETLKSLQTERVHFKMTGHLPEPIMTFVDPEEDDGALFITLSAFQMERYGRPSFVLRKATHKKWFEFYYQSYLNLWNSKETHPVDLSLSWEENLRAMAPG